MNLSSGLPYTSEVYNVAMSDYNGQWYPLIVLGLIIGLWIIWQARPEASPSRRMLQVIGACLTSTAVWSGLMHQFNLMVPLNFMSTIYAAGFVVFAIWIFTRWVVFVPADTASDMGFQKNIGRVILVFALLGYPATQWIFGVSIASLDYVGTAPNATILFIFGAVLALTGRLRRDLLIIPLIWSGITGLHAYLLHMPADYLVPVLILGATFFSFVLARTTKA